jgi:hypothetical protein
MAAEVNGRNDASVGGEEEVRELLDSVGKLGVEPIGVVGGRRRVLHGEKKAAAGGARRHSSGGRCGALGIQLGGRKASRDREESTWGVVVVREGSEWAAHGEQEATTELGLAGAVEDEARIRKGEIGRAGEHQRVTAVL